MDEGRRWMKAFRGVTNDACSEADRLESFKLLLSLRSEWTKNHFLRDFVKAVALGVARQFRRYGDRVDWEGVADETLMIFFYSAPRLKHREPNVLRSWFRSVAEHLVKGEIKQRSLELNALDVEDAALSLAAVAGGPEQADDLGRETRLEALDERIGALSPSLRELGHHLRRGVPRKDTCKQLGISDDAYRKRLQRLNEALRRSRGT